VSPAAELYEGKFPAAITTLEDAGAGIAVEVATGEAESKPASWASAMMDAIASASIEVEGGSGVETLAAAGVGVAMPVDEEAILTSWGPNGPGDAEEDAATIELDGTFDIRGNGVTDVDPIAAAESVAEGTTIELEEAVGILFEVTRVMDELDPTSAAETCAGAVVEAMGESVAVVDTTESDRTSAAETDETEVGSVKRVLVVIVLLAISEDTTEFDRIPAAETGVGEPEANVAGVEVETTVAVVPGGSTFVSVVTAPVAEISAAESEEDVSTAVVGEESGAVDGTLGIEVDPTSAANIALEEVPKDVDESVVAVELVASFALTEEIAVAEIAAETTEELEIALFVSIAAAVLRVPVEIMLVVVPVASPCSVEELEMTPTAWGSELICWGDTSGVAGVNTSVTFRDPVGDVEFDGAAGADAVELSLARRDVMLAIFSPTGVSGSSFATGA
jgi:hypothetical protein